MDMEEKAHDEVLETCHRQVRRHVVTRLPMDDEEGPARYHRWAATSFPKK